MSDGHPARMGHTDDLVTPPSSPPIYQTTAFDIPDLHVLKEVLAGSAPGFIYTRDSNPNHAALADSMAVLEHAEAGAVFASGMGAISAIMMTFAGTDDHVIVSQSLYGITAKLLRRLQRRFRIQVSSVDATDPAAIAAAIRPNSKLCFVESVSNPLLEVVDIESISGALGNVLLVVDSTFTTPELIRPIECGAALVVHSASKYLNGHGDVMLGVAAGKKELIRRVRSTASVFGQNANPFECWLTQRGLRTLPLRMRQICRTTQQLADFLNAHSAVDHVYFPGLPSHRTHDVSQRLYPNGTGGIIAFTLKDGTRDTVSLFMKAADSLPFCATLADARTTLSHPASTSHGYMSRADREALGIMDSLVRISVGLEDFELLRDELDTALNAVAVS